MPRLIVEHNIYGVDIDPRAAQIASLALWLRAQRAWHDAGVKAQQRPDVGRGHVVAAVAPPAERELRVQFSANLDQRDAELFEKTLQLLKGLPELGVLMQVDRDLTSLVRQVYVGSGTGLFAAEEQESWEKAEVRLVNALAEFVQTTDSTYQGRLFAHDALEGLRLIDLCREVFDVIVMNPPFGEPSHSTKAYLEKNLPLSKGNILTNFIERSAQLIRKGGRIGAIVSRTCFYLQTFSAFRKTVLTSELALESFADLGMGVLDAMVETAAATWERSGLESREAVFFRELNRVDKNIGLLDSIGRLKAGVAGNRYFLKKVSQFSIFEDAPYVYWVSDSIAQKIAQCRTVDPTACQIRVGLQTGDDFRFLRLWWEVQSSNVVVPNKNQDSEGLQEECIELSSDKKWSWYSKTESASPILSSIHLCVNWLKNGSEIKSYHVGNGHSASKYVMSESLYFRPGLSYMLRSSRLVPYLVPSGVIPTAGRSQVYPRQGDEIWLAALLSSNLATAVARFRGEAFWQPKFQNSMVAAVPYIEPCGNILDDVSKKISLVRSRMAEKFKSDESEILFLSPPLSFQEKFFEDFDRKTILGDELDERLAGLLELTPNEFAILKRDHDEALVKTADSAAWDDEVSVKDEVIGNGESADITDQALSWAVGVAFGRFDWRLASGERKSPSEPEPFDPLPAKSPGMLSDGAVPFHQHAGLLVDAPGHPHDLARLVEQVLETVDASVAEDVRRWLQKDFFAFHLKRYSKSRRKAPIYWPLATASGSYTLWFYYPSLSDQTLFTAVNDFVDPKLVDVRKELQTLRDKGAGRSKQDEKSLEALVSLEHELADLRDSLLEIAPNYRPNHDDGVQITAAPLWKLFRHKAWQKVLKDTWAKLEKGDYDWAYLAMNYWSERVREKCVTDKSLAIAHNLEHLYIEPEIAPKKARGRTKKQDV